MTRSRREPVGRLWSRTTVFDRGSLHGKAGGRARGFFCLVLNEASRGLVPIDFVERNVT